MREIDKRYFFLSKMIRGQWLNKFIFWKMAERRKWLVHTAKNEENKNRTSLSILNSYLFSLTPAQKTCFCVHEKCLPHLCSSIMTSIPFWLHKIEKVFYVIKNMETDTNLMSKNEGIVSILNMISVVLRTEATEISLHSLEKLEHLFLLRLVNQFFSSPSFIT